MMYQNKLECLFYLRRVQAIEIGANVVKHASLFYALKNYFFVYWKKFSFFPFFTKVLMEVDKSLNVLIGNTICVSMIVAYAGRLRQNERKMVFEKWRKICDSFKIQVNGQGARNLTGENLEIVT